jgi:orotate phosphoribosyltransferase
VVIVDDVLTAGTAIAEAQGMIRAAGALPIAAVIALDRQEAGPSGRSAVAELSEKLDISVISLVTVRDLLEYLEVHAADASRAESVRAYQARYGAQR